MLLLNAFSLNMLDLSVAHTFKCDPISVSEVSVLLRAGVLESAVGHATTATVLSSILESSVPCNRVSVKLSSGDSCVVAQFVGPRLPEGATTLPEGARIEFVLVTVT